MTYYFGDFEEDATVLIPFNTFSSANPAASITITDLIDADIHVHKDGAVDEIATDGASVIINFDGITGNHLVTILTNAHADYAVGSEYAVRIEGTTVDGATINAWIGAFSIERSGGVLALLKGANGLVALKSDTGAILIDTAVIATDDIPTRMDTLDTAVAAVKTETALIVGDTNELQLDDIPGKLVTLTAVVDTVKSDTAAIGTAGVGLTNLGGMSTAMKAHARTEADNALTAYGANTTTPPTVGLIADQIWQEAQSEHTDAGTFGVIATEIAAIPTDAMRGTDNAALASVVTETRMSELDEGTAGKMANQVDEIRTDTAVIGALGVGLTDLGGMSTAMKAEVNAEAKDVLVTDTVAAPTGVPPSTDTLANKIGFVHEALRNKITITSSKKTFFDDANSAQWEKDLTDAAGTYTETEGNAI